MGKRCETVSSVLGRAGATLGLVMASQWISAGFFPASASSCSEISGVHTNFSGSKNISGSLIGSPTKLCATLPAPATVTIDTGTVGANASLQFYASFFYDTNFVSRNGHLNTILFDAVSIAGSSVADTPFLEILALPVSNQVAATDVNLINVDVGDNRSIHLTPRSGAAVQRQNVYITSTTARTYDGFVLKNADSVLIGQYKLGGTFTKVATDLTLKDSSVLNTSLFGVSSGSTLTLDNSTLDIGLFRLDGALAGNGTIYGVSGAGSSVSFATLAGAILSPGNSIGTLTINGSLDINGSTFLISELNPLASGNADLLNVTGSVLGLNNLTVLLEKDSGYAGSGAAEIADFTGSTYVVLDGSSFNQDGVTLVEGASLNAHLSASLVAAPTAAGKVEVKFTDNSAVATHLPSKLLTLSSGKHVTLANPVTTLTSAISATHSGTTVNGVSGGSGGGGQLLSGGNTLSTAWLSLTNTQLLQLNTVHAEPYSSNLTVALEQVDQIASSVMGRISGGHDVLDQAKTTRDAQGRAIWMDSSGTLGHVEGQDGLGTFDYSLVNLIVGADVLASDAGSAGVFAGYGFHRMSEHDTVDQSFSAHTGYGGAYLTLLPGDWRLALSGGYAYSANSGTRNNPDVGLFTGGRAESDYNSHSAFVAGKVGYATSVTEILSVTPFVSVSYARIWQGEAKEKGGGDFSYDIHAATAEAIVTGVGLDWTADIVNVERSKAQLGGFLRYDHDWSAASDSSHDVSVTSNLFGTFTQSGQNRGPHTLTGGFGVIGAISERAQWRVGLAGSMSPHGHEVGAGGHFTLQF